MCIALDGRNPMTNKELKALLWTLLYSSLAGLVVAILIILAIK